MGPLFWAAAGVAFLLLAAYFLVCGMLVNKFLKRKPDDPEAFLRRMEKGPNAPYFKVIRDNLAWFPAQNAEDVYTQSFVDAFPEVLNEDIEIMKEEAVC